MLDKLAMMPRPRVGALVLSVPAMLCGGVLAVATFAPAQFAAWDAFRLVAIAAAISLPLLGLNCQLSGAALLSLQLPQILAATAEEAKLRSEGKKPGSRSTRLGDDIYWLAVSGATIFSIPPLYAPIIGSVYTTMTLRRAVGWAWRVEVVMLAIQAVLLLLCMAGGVVLTREARAKAESEATATEGQ